MIRTNPNDLPQYMKLSQWRTQCFVEPPHQETCLRWLNNGDIPGKKIGGQWYVDVAAECRSSGNPLVDAVLQG